MAVNHPTERLVAAWPDLEPIIRCYLDRPFDVQTLDRLTSELSDVARFRVVAEVDEADRNRVLIRDACEEMSGPLRREATS